jgi:hypothetical protein
MNSEANFSAEGFPMIDVMIAKAGTVVGNLMAVAVYSTLAGYCFFHGMRLARRRARKDSP